MATTVRLQTAVVNYEVFEGDTLEMLLNYKNADGTQVDLSSVTAKMDIKPDADSAATLTLTDTSGIALGGVSNNIIVTLTPTNTHTTLGVGDFVYDIELTDALNRVNTPIKGKISIKQSVTQ